MHKLTFKEMPVKGQLSDNQLLLSFKNCCFVDINHILCQNDSRKVIKNYFKKSSCTSSTAKQILENRSQQNKIWPDQGSTIGILNKAKTVQN